LRVTEAYLCLEGEGQTLGCPTFLIRLSGCNLRCWWCDSKFSSFREDEARELGWESLRDQALASGAAWVSLTGGEPTWRTDGELEDLARLCAAWRGAGRKVKVETNGLLFPRQLEGQVDLWSVAPKWDATRNPGDQDTDAMRHDPQALAGFVRRQSGPGSLQFKFVITFGSDGKPRVSDLKQAAEIVAALPAGDFPIYLIPEGLGQPMDAYLERNRLLSEALQDGLGAWAGRDVRVMPQWHRVLYSDERKK
jgi:7-carboxy-7-deazaguanine synthase